MYIGFWLRSCANGGTNSIDPPFPSRIFREFTSDYRRQIIAFFAFLARKEEITSNEMRIVDRDK